MTPLILEIVRADWKKRPAVDRAAIMAEMPKPFVPKVNMRYPVGQPLMTFPPNLLKQLHQLPEDLEYRFVGRDLILRDVKANIIVDVIRHATPVSSPVITLTGLRGLSPLPRGAPLSSRCCCLSGGAVAMPAQTPAQAAGAASDRGG